ncbi:MAG: DUF1549 domain-containing protein [Verrucomicrobiales bacterium]
MRTLATIGLRSALAFCALVAGHGFAGEVSFSHDVMAVLSKAGCNGGSCHGNQNGKGDLKLSLWGERPGDDFESLFKDPKLVNRDDPAASLILRKPTYQLKHEGEKRFEVDSPEYRVLIEWINAGAPGVPENEASVESIEVQPSAAILNLPEKSEQIRVVAKFSDGEVRDVTRWATYETSNLNAEVSAEGLLEFAQPAETVVFVRYLEGRGSMRAALIKPSGGYQWRGSAPSNGIDRHVFAKLQQFRENPADRCDDSLFLRRASLDITGALPPAEEARRFVSDPDPEKRRKLVDRLLASPDYANFWALKWCDLLRVEEKTLDSKGVEKFHGWIRDALASGKPLDEFAREILSATGSTYANPPSNFYRALREPVERAEAAAQVFLGSRLKCARCHNHPFEDVRQDDYYRFAAVFDGIDYEIVENKRRDKLDKHQFRGEQKVKLVALDKLDKKKILKHPRSNKPPQPGLLDREAPALRSRDTRLEEMSEWVISHPNFAKVQANRIWFHMTGRALVDPVDDVRDTNPASNPELMAFLEEELRANDFDPKHLIRLIANSQTYQFASDPAGSDSVGGEQNFARSTVRRLPAEVVIDSAHRALGIELEFEDAHQSVRAVQMPGVEKVHLSSKPGHGERFLKLFGKPARLMSSDTERSDETTLGQVFELTGGATLNHLLQQEDNRIGKMLEAGEPDSAIVDSLYWATLTRPPTEHERGATAGYLTAAPGGRRAALEDIAWSLLNAKEFILRK